MVRRASCVGIERAPRGCRHHGSPPSRGVRAAYEGRLRRQGHGPASTWGHSRSRYPGPSRNCDGAVTFAASSPLRSGVWPRHNSAAGARAGPGRPGRSGLHIGARNAPDSLADGPCRLPLAYEGPGDPDHRLGPITRIAGPKAGGRQANAKHNRPRSLPSVSTDHAGTPTTSERNAQADARPRRSQQSRSAPRPAPHDDSLGRSATRPGPTPRVVGVVVLLQECNKLQQLCAISGFRPPPSLGFAAQPNQSPRDRSNGPGA